MLGLWRRILSASECLQKMPLDQFERYANAQKWNSVDYTMQKESLPGFEGQEPMLFGLVKLENGVKIIAQLVDVTYESLKRGTKSRLFSEESESNGESGQIFYGFKFAPSRKKVDSTE